MNGCRAHALRTIVLEAACPSVIHEGWNESPECPHRIGDAEDSSAQLSHSVSQWMDAQCDHCHGLCDHFEFHVNGAIGRSVSTSSFQRIIMPGMDPRISDAFV